MRDCEFADPGPLRDRLVAAVLRGEKTATSSLWRDWEADGEALPEPGERQRVVDSDGRAVATIEITGAEVIRLGEADLALAREEGEGFETVADWRAAHERFWGERLPDDTPIVVERFRLTD